MQSDAGHLIANEKVVAEPMGILVAVGAMALLARLQRRPGRSGL